MSLTTEERLSLQSRGLDIITCNGSWFLVRLNDAVAPEWRGHITLVQTVRRHGEFVVVDASMGPLGTPPKSIFRRWLLESAGQERNEYEQGFIARVTDEHAMLDAQRSLKVGDRFTTHLEWSFSDGVTEREFIYEGKYRARRASDNKTFQLPRNFRKSVAAEVRD